MFKTIITLKDKKKNEERKTKGYKVIYDRTWMNEFRE